MRGDGLHKRGAKQVWYFGYRLGGKWHERSTGTAVYGEARTVRNDFITKLRASGGTGPRLHWTVEFAGGHLLRTKQAAGLRPRTLQILRERLVIINKHLGAKRLIETGPEDLLAFKEARAAKVKPRTFNMEHGILRKIFEPVGRWHEFKEEFTTLREGRGPGRALEPEELKRLLEVTKGNPRFHLVYHLLQFARHTGMRGVEMKGLTLEAIDLQSKQVTIKRTSTKTDAGAREIPLNSAAMESAEWLILRARALGVTKPSHYLLPANRTRRGKKGLKGTAVYDPTKPQKTFRTIWRAAVKEASLKGLRYHDLRHLFRSDLADHDVNDEIAMALMGHKSAEETARYRQMRKAAVLRMSERKREAVDVIASVPSVGSEQ